MFTDIYIYIYIYDLVDFWMEVRKIDFGTNGVHIRDNEVIIPPFCMEFRPGLNGTSPGSNIQKNHFLFSIFDPWLVPLSPGRNSVQNGGIIASLSLMSTPFVPKSIFWTPVEKKVKKYIQALPGNMSLFCYSARYWKHEAWPRACSGEVREYGTHTLKKRYQFN